MTESVCSITHRPLQSTRVPVRQQRGRRELLDLMELWKWDPQASKPEPPKCESEPTLPDASEESEEEP